MNRPRKKPTHHDQVTYKEYILWEKVECFSHHMQK